MSCNGCRVLRKGCGEDCILRTCLSLITSPESQANATLFLAKFYGRAGLLNLINAAPHHLCREIFTSLLHEACGRIINPTYGSVGLMWSGNWEQCQGAVDSVLQGSTIMQGENHDYVAIIPLESCDIRHLSKDTHGEHHRVKIRNKFKRPRCGSVSAFQKVDSTSSSAEPEAKQAMSHESLSVEIVEAGLLKVDGNESGKINLLELSIG